jgi:hypothetical protein
MAVIVRKFEPPWSRGIAFSRSRTCGQRWENRCTACGCFIAWKARLTSQEPDQEVVSRAAEQRTSEL